MIVNFAIERDDEASGCALHGLVTGRGKVKDAEAAVPKCEVPRIIQPHTVIVRASMTQCRRHSRDNLSSVV
jgi:hypothetical protein